MRRSLENNWFAKLEKNSERSEESSSRTWGTGSRLLGSVLTLLNGLAVRMWAVALARGRRYGSCRRGPGLVVLVRHARQPLDEGYDAPGFLVGYLDGAEA